ncbi:MAG: alpha/beta hydrolase [Blastocatellia bacterium]
MSGLAGNTFFEGPAGRIEAILRDVEPPVRRAAIVCHPHPLFGGTMHNKVVFRISRAFQEAGFAVLRFNFRGTGRSQGTHDEGRGEQDDLRAAITFIEQKYADAEVWLAGFSFGAAVMLRVACGDSRIAALIAAGAPVSKYDFSELIHCDRPKLFVQGALDEFGSPDELARFVTRLDEPKTLKVIEDADHFFAGHLDELAQTVADFIAKG